MRAEAGRGPGHERPDPQVEMPHAMLSVRSHLCCGGALHSNNETVVRDIAWLRQPKSESLSVCAYVASKTLTMQGARDNALDKKAATIKLEHARSVALLLCGAVLLTTP